jgi:hypothetical protein
VKGLFCWKTLCCGMEMLLYLRELGCVFDASATIFAAEKGDLEALRYLHMAGAQWDCRTLYTAVWADSLPCLEYAHIHGCPQEDEQDHRDHKTDARSLPVLRYVCEHMNPAFAAKTLEATATSLDREVNSLSDWSSEWRRGDEVDWPLALYVGRKLGPALPKDLAEAIAGHKERAAALAGVF